ncbi:MAG TPA: HAMP domain-containing sensor histidine kinase [Pirellulales bacterium]
MRWPLRYQILLPFTLVLLGAIVAVSVVSAVLATQRAGRQIEELLQSIAQTLSEPRFPLTDAVLRQMHGLSGAEFVLTDQQGRVLASSGEGQLPENDRQPVVQRWEQLHLGPPVQIGNQAYFEMVLAMNERGTQRPGQLHLLYPERNWQEERHDAAVPPLVVGGVAMLATALIALLLAGRLTRPIVELRSQVRRIAQADYAPMPLPNRNDELRDLAADVNRMAEQLSEMERAIRRGERMALLGQLAGGLAHHLRNNVTGALMAVQLHARECNADPESLKVALRQLALTEENLKQFLAAPQATPGTTAAMHPTDCHLGDIVQEVIELVGPSLRHRHVELKVADNADRHDAEDRLHADPGQLRQMLMNLVLNAAEAAGPGGWVKLEMEMAAANSEPSPSGRGQGEGEEAKIGAGIGEKSNVGIRKAETNGRSFPSALHPFSLSPVQPTQPPHPGPLPEGEGVFLAPAPPAEIVLRVIDNGPGPPAQIVERLFEPFATSKPEGIGLGLAVARQIAHSHGGAIVFEHASGETKFEVRLPAAGKLQNNDCRVQNADLKLQSIP